jgi:rubrerythrin
VTPLESVQRTLAGEHAAVYVYGVLGGRASASGAPELWKLITSAYTTHRGRRDQLAAMVRAMDEQPVAAEVSYTLPNRARSTRQIRSAALELEEASAARYAEMVGNTAQANRQWAIEALTDAAVRGLALGGQAEAFPGVDEL